MGRLDGRSQTGVTTCPESLNGSTNTWVRPAVAVLARTRRAPRHKTELHGAVPDHGQRAYSWNPRLPGGKSPNRMGFFGSSRETSTARVDSVTSILLVISGAV